MLAPRAHLIFCWMAFFLLVSFVAIDVGHPVAKVGAILAPRIISRRLGVWGCKAMTRGTQVGDMFIDNAQGLIHDGTVLTIHMAVD